MYLDCKTISSGQNIFFSLVIKIVRLTGSSLYMHASVNKYSIPCKLLVYLSSLYDFVLTSLMLTLNY